MDIKFVGKTMKKDNTIRKENADTLNKNREGNRAKKQRFTFQYSRFPTLTGEKL